MFGNMANSVEMIVLAKVKLRGHHLQEKIICNKYVKSKGSDDNTESTDIPRSSTTDVKTGAMSSGCSIMGC